MIQQMKAQGIKRSEEHGGMKITFPLKILIAILLLLTFWPFYYIVKYYNEIHRNGSILTLMICFGTINLTAIYLSIYHLKRDTPLLSLNHDINRSLERMSKCYWVSCCLAIAIMNTIFSVITFFYLRMLLKHYLYFLLATYVYVLIVFYLLKKCPQILHRKQNAVLTPECLPYSEEDHCWVWGMLYCNPFRSKVFVKSRFTSGYTINHAHPVGHLLSILRNLLWISGLFLCIWSIFLEVTPLTLTLDSETRQIVGTQLRDEFEISIDSIDSIKLIEEIPVYLVTNSLPSVTKGEYNIPQYGMFTVFIQPQNTYFIYLTANDKQYLISSYDDESTLKFYDLILNNRSE